jgi:hypothetical protein
MSQAEFQENIQRRAEGFGGQNSPQFQQFVAFANQVRSMPDTQYRLQRERLMAQMMTQGRGGGPGFGLAGNDEEAANAFVERYLLSPRAPVVAAERLRAH